MFLKNHKAKFGKKETPILFSGMISGQRALDKGSLERLKLHIAWVLKDRKICN